jgi:hypothetical protein
MGVRECCKDNPNRRFFEDAHEQDRAPEQEVKVMRTEDYDTAERNLGQPVKTPDSGDWYCWSMFLKSYWKPSGKMSPAGWPGHTIRCGRYEVAPWPLEGDDGT